MDIQSPLSLSPNHQPLPNQEIPKTCCDKVWKIAKVILLTGIVAGLFIANSTLFCIGCLLGAICSEQVNRAIEKIVKIWKKQAWVGTLAIIGMAIFSFPFVLTASCFFVAAKLGSYAYNLAEEQQAPVFIQM